MADKKNQEVPQEENLSQLLQIRRDKLKELQESGNDPFQITRYEMDNDSANIKANFDALEGQLCPWPGGSCPSGAWVRCPSAICRTSPGASSCMPAGMRWTRRSTPIQEV